MCHSCRKWNQVLWQFGCQGSDDDLHVRGGNWVTPVMHDLYTFSIVGGLHSMWPRGWSTALFCTYTPCVHEHTSALNKLN